ESDSLTKDGNKYLSPYSLTQTDEVKKCSGQGIYVLTDGEPNKGTTADLSRAAIGKTTFPSCTGTSPGWDCIGKLNSALLDPTKNEKQLKFKKAMVGFGNSFNNIPKYDVNKSQAENLAPFVNTDGTKKTNLTNVQEAAYWGIMGEGGWYSGNEAADIVESVNDFISNLSKDIPSVTTGSPTIPRETLNPAELQHNADYQSYQPTPNTNYQ